MESPKKVKIKRNETNIVQHDKNRIFSDCSISIMCWEHDNDSHFYDRNIMQKKNKKNYTKGMFFWMVF